MFKMDPPKGFDKWFVVRCSRSNSPSRLSSPFVFAFFADLRSFLIFFVPRFTAFDFVPSILPPAHESFVPFLSIPGQILRERMHRLDDAGQTFAVEFR